MTPAERRQVELEAISIFEALRRLGFQSENIYMRFATDNIDGDKGPCLIVYMENKTKDRRWYQIAGHVPEADKKIVGEELIRLAADFNAHKVDAEVMRHYQRAKFKEDAFHFVISLAVAGFQINPERDWLS